MIRLGLMCLEWIGSFKKHLKSGQRRLARKFELSKGFVEIEAGQALIKLY